MKRLDLNQSVYALCKQAPELLEILASLGFEDIAKPGMLAGVGRFMTLPKGAALKRLDFNEIKKQLAEKGFSVME